MADLALHFWSAQVWLAHSKGEQAALFVLDLAIIYPAGALIQSHGDNLMWRDADHRVVRLVTSAKQRLAAGGYRLRRATDLHEARLPGRQYIVDHKGYIRVLQNIAELLALAHEAPADLDHLQLGVVVEADRRDLRRAVGPNGRQPAQALAADVLDLFFSKCAHSLVILSGIALVCVQQPSAAYHPDLQRYFYLFLCAVFPRGA